MAKARIIGYIWAATSLILVIYILKDTIGISVHFGDNVVDSDSGNGVKHRDEVHDECACLSEVSKSKYDSVGGWQYNPVTIKRHHVWFDSGFAQEILRIVLTRTPKKDEGRKPTIGDIGAGVGQFGAILKDMKNDSVEWHGFDGGSNVNDFCGQTLAVRFRDKYLVPKVCFLDASVPVNPKDLESDGAPFDWVMSVEVGEHIPKEYQFNFIDNLIRLSKHGIILTWAVKGQGGHGHVNTMDNKEVIKIMQLRNMYYLPNESAYIRKQVKTLPWLRNTVMVFSKFEGMDRAKDAKQ